MLSQNIAAYCQQLEQEFSLIPQERKALLLSLSDYISTKIAQGLVPQIIVICTHNSRRSHIGQLWLAVGAEYYQLPSLKSYSGGTEATAFNIRAVRAFQKIGFNISPEKGSSENPTYVIRWNNQMASSFAFSKKYDAAPNPQQDFAAIMVCSEADGACPVVYGCDFRLALPYDDPKDFDDTPFEAEKYDERVKEIGREILFALSNFEKR